MRYLFFILLLVGCKTTRISETNSYRQLAEYEPTAAVWMIMPTVQHKKDKPLAPVLLELFRAITSETELHILVANDSLANVAKMLLADSLVQPTKATIHQMPYSEFWARDMGPRFIKHANGNKAIADFNFNTWNYYSDTAAVARLDESLDERIAAKLNLPVLSSSLITEGGDNEISSEGVLMLTESVQLFRNPGWSKKRIENAYRKLLGARQFIWFQQGLRDDDFTLNGPIKGLNDSLYFTSLTTNGHVDEYARFVNDSVVLMASGDTAAKHPIEKESAVRLYRNRLILEKSTRPGGQPFHIIEMPLVPLITSHMHVGDGPYDFLQQQQFMDGSKYGTDNQPMPMVAAASYLNFLIINQTIIVPQYAIDAQDKLYVETDKVAMQQFKKAFPGFKIIPIHPIAINWGGGGIHCITANEPK